MGWINIQATFDFPLTRAINLAQQHLTHVGKTSFPKSRINFFSQKSLEMPRFEPGLAGWEVQSLPLAPCPILLNVNTIEVSELLLFIIKKCLMIHLHLQLIGPNNYSRSCRHLPLVLCSCHVLRLAIFYLQPFLISCLQFIKLIRRSNTCCRLGFLNLWCFRKEG